MVLNNYYKVRGTTLTQGRLKAMSDLEEFEKERRNKEYMEDAKTGVIAVGLQNCGARTASNEMCIFLIAYRSQYGSANPAAVIAPAVVITLIIKIKQ